MKQQTVFVDQVKEVAWAVLGIALGSAFPAVVLILNMNRFLSIRSGLSHFALSEMPWISLFLLGADYLLVERVIPPIGNKLSTIQSRSLRVGATLVTGTAIGFCMFLQIALFVLWR